MEITSIHLRVPAPEFSAEFAQGMANAMAMSCCKYGPVADAYPRKVDALASLRLRLDRYEQTGNLEYLIDVANFAMIEFMHPRHPQAHHKAEDSHASPGRVWHSGAITEAANTLAQDNIRKPFYNRSGD